MKRLHNHWSDKAWFIRARGRHKTFFKITHSPKLSHDEKVVELEQHRDSILRWLRFWRLWFIFDSNVAIEVIYAKDEVKRINIKIEKIKKSKTRKEKWELANPTHPYNRRKRP